MLSRETLPKRFFQISQTWKDRPVQHFKTEKKTFLPTTYGEFWSQVEAMGAGLASLGFKRGDHLGVISDNCPQWLIADQSVLGLGCVNVPRGSDSTQEEIGFILDHGDCTGVFVEDPEQLVKVLQGMGPRSGLQHVILFTGVPPKVTGPEKVKVYSFEDILNLGRNALGRDPDFFQKELEKGSSEDLATIIYTSGTTGQPKGVMLTHTSFLFQVDRTDSMLIIDQNDILLSVLPIWHSFERAVEYIILGKGGSIAYSKPIGKILMDDMAEIRPTFFPSVPRIWESVRAGVLRNVKSQSLLKQKLFDFFMKAGKLHSDLLSAFQGRLPAYWKPNRLVDMTVTLLPLLAVLPVKLLGDLLVFKNIKSKLGGRFKAGISGGGALPVHVDQFFRAAGIPVLEGYGLTETGPILSVRLQWAPMPRTVGPILPDIEYKALGDDGQPVTAGHRGVLHVKSPQVMKGYYKRPEETAKVLKDGWLNTGDIVVPTVGREITIVGRAKDTIVLMGGENIEPEPIEQKLLQSDFIDQVIVVGQDQKFLGALIVPNFEALEKFGLESKLEFLDREELNDRPEVQEFYHELIQELIGPKTGFKSFERIYKFALLPKAFDAQTEVTQTLKLKRNVIFDHYRGIITKLFQ